MTSALLGYWQGEWTEPTTLISPLAPNGDNSNGSGRRHGPSTGNSGLFHDTGGDWLQPSSTEGDVALEDEYDAPVLPLAETSTKASGSSRARVGTVPRAGTADAIMQHDDWRKFPPPLELYTVPFGTPMEIESIIEASVERLQESLAKEESLRENAEFERGRQEGKAKERMIIFDEPNQQTGLQPQVSTSTATSLSGGLERNRSFYRWSRARVSDASDITTSSADSGYVSGPADPVAPKSRFSGFFSFSKALRGSRRQASQSSQSSGAEKECVSCLEEFNPKEVVPLKCHSYCKACFQTLINTALQSESQWPPKCCLNEIPTEVLLPHLSPKTKKKYREVLEERSVPAGDRIYCSKTSCGAWIPPKNINRAISCAACSHCRQKSCVSCRGEYHSTGECPSDPSLQATLQLANSEGWRRCYSCNAMVEHNQGCIHMTCKCKAQFCYICGLRWRTCACSDHELDAVRQNAEARRLAVQTRDQEETIRTQAAEAEAAEMREILEEIERYELEEAAELARAEEELRQITIQARQQRQERRILATTKRFAVLRSELDFLQALQRVAMAERYEAEAVARRHNANVARADMCSRHVLEIEMADSVGAAKVSDSQFAFDMEFGARTVQERGIEAKFVEELRRYWEGKPEADEKVEQGREELKVTHQETYRKWEVVQKEKHHGVMERVRRDLEGLRRKQEEELSRLESEYGEAGEWSRVAGQRKGADDGWIAGVTGQRLRMLAEMEEDEFRLSDDD